jgi:putative membrane protein
MIRTNDEQATYRGEALAVRGIIGGALMGLANLVPGISGGTMLLAAGLYPQFINGVAELSTFRFRGSTILTMVCIVGAALVAIAGFAGPVSGLVVHHRWIMYSLFIGLTLGGVPVLWPLIRPLDPKVVIAAVVGISIMAVMALVGPGQSSVTADGHPYGMYFLAGLAGAAAMVLPGISGGYLLLILGQYVAILSAVAVARDGLRSGDLEQVGQALHVIVPVGLGVLAGVVGVSNAVKLLLERYRRATLGVLLGLLLGAVLGLWPFQQGVAPAVGSIFRGDEVTLVDGQLTMAGTGRPIEPKDYDTAFFQPALLQVAGSLGLIAAGLLVALGVSHLGAERGSSSGLPPADDAG